MIISQIKTEALKNLTNIELEDRLRTKSIEERKLTIEIIELLEEVDRRKLHLKHGYGSLIEYCIKELKYSESSAYRRISAMRVVREVPNVKIAIQDGKLNLNTIAQAQTFFKSEAKQNKPYTKEAKQNILALLQYKSTRQAERLLVEISPENAPVKTETVRAVAEDRTQITLTVNRELADKLDKLKNMLSHKIPSGRYTELIEHLADLALIKYDIHQEKIEKRHEATYRIATPAPVLKDASQTALVQKSAAKNPMPNTAANSLLLMKSNSIIEKKRYISTSTKKQVWQKSQGRCTYTNSTTGRQCSANKFLEIDHIVPISKSGSNAIENLILLCDAHNRLKSDRIKSDHV